MEKHIKLIQKQINAMIKSQGELLSNSISSNTKLDFIVTLNEMVFLLKDTNINGFIEYFEKTKKRFYRL